ncbi:MAG: AtpZ/AtpI family protein [Acidobacteriota bacterium]|nr:AtpZ/AtpI family protein [Acidobacteriota bacterium]
MATRFQQYGDLLTLGIMFPACIAIGYGLGYLLDSWTGSRNTFSFIGILFGITAAFVNLFRVVKKVDGKE